MKNIKFTLGIKSEKNFISLIVRYHPFIQGLGITLDYDFLQVDFYPIIVERLVAFLHLQFLFFKPNLHILNILESYSPPERLVG